MSNIEIRRILCPIDFSTLSKQASQYALALAAGYEAELVALHVCADETSITRDPVYLSASERPNAGSPKAALDQLSEIVRPLRALGLDPKVELREGGPGAEIVTVAEDLPADLVVMGTHGCAGFRPCELGSVAETVLRRVHCPVLTVPGQAHDRPGPEAFKTIVCATDFSPAAVAAVRYAACLAKAVGVRLILAHVIDPGKKSALEEPSKGFVVGYENSARLMLRDALPAHEGFSVEEVVGWGLPAPEILELATAQDAGVIVIGMHGRSFRDLMAFGSVAHELVLESTCPVLTVRSLQTCDW